MNELGPFAAGLFLAGVIFMLLMQLVWRARWLTGVRRWIERNAPPIFKRLFGRRAAARENLFEIMPSGLLILDERERVVDANPLMLRICGHPAPAPAGAALEMLFASQPGLLAALRAAQSAEQEAWDAAGQKCYVVLVSRLPSAADSLYVFRDITASKMMVERLRAGEQREHELRMLSDVLVETSKMIHGTLDLDEVLDQILQNLHRVVSYEVSNIMLVNEQGVVYVVRTSGYTGSLFESPYGKVWLPVASTPSFRWMSDHQRPLLIRDVRDYAGWIEVPGQELIRSHVSAPILTSQGLAGFLSMDSAQPGYYTEKDAEQLMLFANQAGVALDNARLYSQIRKTADERAILQEIALAVSASLDFQDVIQRIFDLISRLVPSDAVGVQLIEGNSVVLKAFRGFTDSEKILGTRWVMAGTANERVLQARKSMLFLDVQAEFPGYRVPPHNQIRSLLMLPLIAGGEVLGFLSLDSFVLAHFTEEDLRLANLFSGAIAVALENARLYELSRRRNEDLQILNQVGLAVTSGLELDQVLIGLYEQCRLVMPIDSFSVALYHPESGEIEFPLIHENGVFHTVPALSPAGRKGMAGQVMDQGVTLYLPDVLDPASAEKYHWVNFGGPVTRSYLGVPLILRETVIGVLSIQCQTPHAYTPDRVRLVEMISTHAAIAIENARLYQQAQTAAAIDDLTGLLSRRELFRRAELEFIRAYRYHHPLSVMMLDIDYFKRVNDSYGHLAGDQVLRSLARVCQENMRLVDVVGRYGGEEVLILMPETDLRQAGEAAERLRLQIDKMVVAYENASISVTVSIGVAGLGAHPDLAALVIRADEALFQAKKAGRNRVHLAG